MTFNGDGVSEILTAPGFGRVAEVRIFDSTTGEQITSLVPYPGFTGGVFGAAGDVNGDGRDDIITALGPGREPLVSVFSGVDGAKILEFMAYAPTLTQGVFVAARDVNGDGRDDIITGTGSGGGPQVRTFSGVDFVRLSSFFAYANTFNGGIFVAGTRQGTEAAGLRLAANAPELMSAAEPLSRGRLETIRTAALERWESGHGERYAQAA